MNRKPRVAFVCRDNTKHSQLGEALAKWYGQDVIEAFSAGVEAGDGIEPEAITAMQEVYQVDISQQQSPKVWHDLPEVDIVISLNSDLSDNLPEEMSARYVEHWDIPDPEHDGSTYADTIETLSEKVRYLIDLIIRGRYPIDEADESE